MRVARRDLVVAARPTSASARSSTASRRSSRRCCSRSTATATPAATSTAAPPSTSCARELPGLVDTIDLPYLGGGGWETTLPAGDDLEFAELPFGHPLWVLYSSGTTGPPKALVHSQGGILLEHLKTLRLHADLRRGDRFFWFTTTGWMMWNLLVGGLLTDSAVVLYDGSPAAPDLDRLWDLAASAGITCFGTSAAYLGACMKEQVEPATGRDLSRLRSVGSTGSPLSPAGFRWVGDHVGRDVWLFSMSGGTDVCTAFVGGVPTLPVHEGELQARALGAKVESFDPAGRPLVNEVGELVLTEPMPSMPVRFWGDADGSRYRESYFSTYPGVWRHGDWITITDRGTAVIHGRSDSTINRGGVRMGTSEIYGAVLAIDEIVDALVVDVPREGTDGWMPLFVVLREGDGADRGAGGDRAGAAPQRLLAAARPRRDRPGGRGAANALREDRRDTGQAPAHGRAGRPGRKPRRTRQPTGPGRHRSAHAAGDDLTGPTMKEAATNPQDVLTAEAIEFLTQLERTFRGEREALLDARGRRARRLRDGELPGFLEERPAGIDGAWSVPPAPADLADRRVEITGPAERKMVINALNSGAKVFMADFEDANSPTWENMLAGQVNLSDAIDRTIRIESGGKTYELGDRPATLVVRPRGWHLDERHFAVDGRPVSGSLFDFGLYLLRNHGRLQAIGSGPYLYLPKLESHLEARLWNDVFGWSQRELGLAHGTVRATVLIETVLAAFEMEEILYELGPHATALNAGRWDYLFSLIKKLGHRPEFVLPDRNSVGMTAPFMRAYAELLVKVCHRRSAHAIGGMSAFIPTRRDPEVNAVALERVREDKEREASQGYDGTWVAHPDLVPVAMAAFDRVLGARPNQLDVLRDDVEVAAGDLLDVSSTPGEITDAGLRNNVSVGIQYLAAWLQGSGAVAIFNLMEDAATAEISRSQVWQWIRHGEVSRDDVLRVIDEEMAKLGPGHEEARELFQQLATADELVEFLTLPAYELLDRPA